MVKNWVIRTSILFFMMCSAEYGQKGMAILKAAHLSDTASEPFSHKVIELSTKGGTYNINSSLEIIEDKTAALTFDDIRSPRYDTAFKHFTKQGDPSFGFTSSIFWVRFHLRLADTVGDFAHIHHKTEWYLSNEYPLVDNIQLFAPTSTVSDSGRTTEYFMQQSGDMFPFSMRGVEYRMPNLQLPNIGSNVCVVYLRLQTQGSLTFPLVIRSDTAMNQHISNEQFVLGIFYGILIIMLCYNLLMYLSLRDKSLGFYALYIVLYGMFLMVWNGLAFQYFWSNSPLWHNRSLLVFAPLAGISVSLFSQSYLNSRQYTPRLHKILSGVNIWFLLCAGLGAGFVLNYSQVSILIYVPICIAIPTALAMSVIGMVKGYRPARYFFVAWVILLIGILAGILRAFGIVSSGIVTMHGLQIGSTLEILLISIGLADRINIIRQEKKQAQEEMIEMLRRSEQELERKVQERTIEISDANEEIQRQMEVLAEQAREIELTNTMLQEKNIIIEQDRASLSFERERSERLLLSVLPAPIAERMKQGETRIAEHFPNVTVLFADVVGFTKLSANVNPRELVELLDAIFTALDALAAKHGLEKIKTIGDAYMVVCGVPVPMEDHCERVARFAIEMQSVIDNVRLQWVLDGKELGSHAIKLRVGIHTGEVVAGIIGTQKFTYDLWGDTVNTASRMESHGDPGKIHISTDVYDILQKKFIFEERGEIDIKGKGIMQTYFLKGAG